MSSVFPLQRRLAVQYVRGLGNCVTCSSAPVVGITITGPAWTLLLLPASVLGGSALSAKCAKPAGKTRGPGENPQVKQELGLKIRGGGTLLCAPRSCRKPGNDSKMLVCETCDKGYHTFCLKPPMEELPAHSWKCKVTVPPSRPSSPNSAFYNLLFLCCAESCALFRAAL